MSPTLPRQGLDALRALFAPMGAASTEVAAIAYLDGHQRLLGMRHIAGARDWLAVPIRAIAADALLFDAEAAVMAHNHPSGDARPSSADLAFTRRLGRALDALGVVLLDHLVLAGVLATSLRAEGYL